MSKTKILTLVFSFLILGSINSFAGFGIQVNETDNGENFSLFAFYDLRDRESFLQITNTFSGPARVHVQIFNVGNLCNENNFFDEYTGNDTHVYNMRDILTNDTNPSGVDLPEDAYGIVAFSTVVAPNNFFIEGALVGNFRVLDNAGFEYRTNMVGITSSESFISFADYTANFNQQGGVSFSDIVGLILQRTESSTGDEWDASDILNTFIVADVDIIDNSEVLLSCRDVIFACIKPDDAIVDELFAISEGTNGFVGQNGASVASFEYGINNTIPHSKGGELLCPGNVIGEGILNLTIQGIAPDNQRTAFPAFIGLNNGNGRGSMDSLWQFNGFGNVN